MVENTMVNESVELTGAACVQGSKEWLEYRKSHISATDIAPIIGISPWESTLSLYALKTSDEFVKKESQYLEWGSRLEPVIIDKLVETYNIKNDKRGKVYVNGWKMASLDGEGEYNGERVGIEAKTASDRRKWFAEDGSEIVPPYYVAQAMWQMIVCGFRKVIFTVLVDGHEWFSRLVEYNEEYAQEIEKAAGWFYDHLVTKTAINTDELEFKHSHYVESAKKDLQQLALRTALPDSTEVQWSLVQKLKDAQAVCDEAEANVAAAKADLVNALNGYEVGEVDGRKVCKMVNNRWGKSLKLYV